jgi:hypothetical protein
MNLAMSRGRYNTESPSISQIIADLKARVARLEAGNRAGNTSVDKGTFAVNGGAFTVGSTAYLGSVNLGEGASQGAAFYRADGTVAFQISGASDASQSWALRDGKGNLVAGDDRQTKTGLARPWVPINWVEHANILPTNSTSSSTFVPLVTGRMFKQHPQVFVTLLVYCSTGATAGEAVMYIAGGGPQVGNVATVSAGYYGLVYLGPAPVQGNHMNETELEIQVRRTAGAGTVAIRVMNSYGLESS